MTQRFVACNGTVSKPDIVCNREEIHSCHVSLGIPVCGSTTDDTATTAVDRNDRTHIESRNHNIWLFKASVHPCEWAYRGPARGVVVRYCTVGCLIQLSTPVAHTRNRRLTDGSADTYTHPKYGNGTMLSRARHLSKWRVLGHDTVLIADYVGGRGSRRDSSGWAMGLGVRMTLLVPVTGREFGGRGRWDGS